MSGLLGFGRAYIANSARVIRFSGPGMHREFVIHYDQSGAPVVTPDYLAYGHLLNEQLESTLLGRHIQRELRENWK
jgi:hypothetical protein